MFDLTKKHVEGLINALKDTGLDEEQLDIVERIENIIEDYHTLVNK